MKKIKSIVLVFLLALLFVPFNSVKAKMIDGWVINNYTTKMDVSESGLIHVWTQLDVDFETPSHGIFAQIPVSYHMTWEQDGKKISKSYIFPISNIQVDNFDYDTDEGFKGITIKIGSEDTYLSGKQTFTYSYDIQMRDLELDGKQMFYWNIVGDSWETNIENTNFTINLPTSQMNSIHFYPPTNLSQQVSYNITENTITGSYQGSIRPGKALTVLVNLPDDTFTFPEVSSAFYYIFATAMFIILIAVIYLYNKYGKDDPIVETVEFDAPEGISSAQAGYILSGEVNHKSITSLIIYWGSKGYLKIEVLENDTLNLEKLKDIDESEIKAEKSLFNALFKKGDLVNTKKLGSSFGTEVQSSMSSIPLNFKKGEHALFEADATRIKWFSIALIPLLFSLFMALGSTLYFPYFLYTLICFGITLVLSVLIFVITSSSTEYSRSKTTVSKTASTFGKIIVIVFYAATMFFIAYYVRLNLVLFSIVLALLIATMPFISYMTKRTAYGRDIFGKTLGLKRFIEVAEKDRIEALVNDDPSYFFKVLPYAYALGVTSVWMSKFEHIAMTPPEWIGGYHSDLATYVYLNALNRSFNSLNTSVVNSIPEVKSGSGGGSFGGGGGGGFSGGGFGGGGGGRW